MTLRTSTAVVLVTAVALAGCREEPVDSVVDLVVPVTVQPVTKGTIESFVSTTGSLRANRAADILVEVRGELHYVPGPRGRKPVEGARVKAGQQIARIESDEYTNSIRLESLEIALQDGLDNLAEQQVLFEDGLALRSDVQSALKIVADAKADITDANIQLGKMNVLAPLTGYLTGLVDTAEETVVEANTVIGQVSDYGGVVVDLKIPNSQMTLIAIGQEVRITNYAFRDQVFSGRIAVIDPTIDPTTRTFRIEVTVDNPDLILRPGMFVKADIVVDQRQDVLVISRELILSRGGRDIVFVEEGGVAQERRIKTGLEDEARVEVVDGLSEGERLIASNYETLRSRTQVRVTDEIGPPSSS